MTISSFITIATSFLAALISLFGAVQTQKAYKAKKRDRAAKRRKNMKQIMSTLAETKIVDSTLDEDFATDFSVVEKILLDNVGKKYERLHKYKKNGKFQFQISTDDSVSQKQQHIG